MEGKADLASGRQVHRGASRSYHRLVMQGKVLAVAVMFMALAAGAAELSGSFSTSLTLGSSFSAQNNLALRLSFSSFELQSISTWQNLALTQQTFTVTGNLGNLGLQVGLVLEPVSPLRWGSWTAQDFQVTAGFVSLELTLGQIRFTLTVQAGAAGP